MNFLRIILLAFVTLIFSFISVLNADVDEDCLCIPVNESFFINESGDAIDTCYMNQILGWDIKGKTCQQILFKYISAIHNNTDSNYVLSRKSVYIKLEQSIFDKDNFKIGDTLFASDVSDNFSTIKAGMNNLSNVIGEYVFIIDNVFKIQNQQYVYLQLITDKYIQYPRLLNSIKVNLGLNNNSITVITFDMLTYSNSEGNNNSNIMIIDNKIVSEVHMIKSVIVFDLYGRKISEFNNIYSNIYDLNDLVGAYMLEVSTGRSNHILKYINF